MYRQAFLLSLIGILGVLSLLASSPPPPFLNVSTQNNVYTQQVYDDASPTVFACSGETVTLAWGVNSSGTSLSVEPAAALDPNLDGLSLIDYNTREAQVLQEARVSLSGRAYSREYPIEVAIGLLEPDYCTAYDFVLVGLYEATLAQSEPDESVLERQLGLQYLAEQDARPAGLYLSLSEFLDGHSSFDGPFLCNLDTLADTLTCSDDSFSLTADITADGLSGSYTGEREAAGVLIDFSGTFSALKQTGSPLEAQE